MGAKYKYNPIVEAICEFQFEPNAEWDLTIPGLVFDQLKHEFPTRRVAKTVGINITDKQEPTVFETDRVQFFRRDETALVQVGPNLLAVNRLKPYDSWEEFFPLIMLALGAYTSVAGPQTFRRLGLRYINHIRIPSTRIELEDYFEFRPVQGPRLPEDFGNFVAGMLFGFEDGRDILKVQLANLHPDPQGLVPFALDLEYFLNRPGGVSQDHAADWIQEAHLRVEDAFEACIKEPLRQMFQEGSL
ncbi:MAG TPA: TIGR04255 family protein [Herpetosiphonaceae bacterium]|nr:TIGR04255 family protein [Herpetosiphonaceae bacterium]